MKNQKGITLVALIITIIVMLILVTVSVTVALQSGLFNAAKSGVQKTNTAVNEENKLSSGVVNVNGKELNLQSDANTWSF